GGILDVLDVVMDWSGRPTPAQVAPEAQAEGTPEAGLGADAAHLSGGGDARASTTLLGAASHRAQEYLRQHATRRAARGYALGLIAGVAVSLILLLVIAWLALVVASAYIGVISPAQRGADPVGNVAIELQFVLVCIGGGAAGATVSAMVRLRGE